MVCSLEQTAEESLGGPVHLETIAHALAEIKRQVAALEAQLAEAQGRRDPFVGFLFQERARYRPVALNDRKSGKNQERFVEQSYMKAQSFGFRGSMREWWALLSLAGDRIGKPDRSS